jgi:hypothetical protein
MVGKLEILPVCPAAAITRRERGSQIKIKWLTAGSGGSYCRNTNRYNSGIKQHLALVSTCFVTAQFPQFSSVPKRLRFISLKQYGYSHLSILRER